MYFRKNKGTTRNLSELFFEKKYKIYCINFLTFVAIIAKLVTQLAVRWLIKDAVSVLFIFVWKIFWKLIIHYFQCQQQNDIIMESQGRDRITIFAMKVWFTISSISYGVSTIPKSLILLYFVFGQSASSCPYKGPFKNYVILFWTAYTSPPPPCNPM